MAKIIFILTIFLFSPLIVSASTAGDFTVNSQPTYDAPPGVTDLLILDLTLPDSQLRSIKISSAGNLQQREVLQLSVYEDGSSSGWDGDELEKTRVSSSPFFDTELSGIFSKTRIFVTVNVTSTAISGRTIKPELALNSATFSDANFNGPTDQKIIGLERTIKAGVSMPSTPVSPLAQKGEALSTSTIRWRFTDLSNNEFGFKILDGNLKEVARKEEANLSYLDETGLQPDTEYSSRKLFAFNDKGVSLTTSLTIFPAVRTLPLPAVIEEPAAVETTTTATTTEDNSEFLAKIQELQLKIIDVLKQMILIFQQKISQAQASLFKAFEIFVDWFRK